MTLFRLHADERGAFLVDPEAEASPTLPAVMAQTTSYAAVQVAARGCEAIIRAVEVRTVGGEIEVTWRGELRTYGEPNGAAVRVAAEMARRMKPTR